MSYTTSTPGERTVIVSFRVYTGLGDGCRKNQPYLSLVCVGEGTFGSTVSKRTIHERVPYSNTWIGG